MPATRFFHRCPALSLALGALLSGAPSSPAASPPSHQPHPTPPRTQTTPVDPLPGPAPGPAQATIADSILTLGNHLLSASWSTTPTGLRLVSIRDHTLQRQIDGRGELFVLRGPGGYQAPSSRWTAERPPIASAWRPQPNASRAAARLPGQILELPLRSDDGRWRATWRAILHDGSRYLRQELALTALHPDAALEEIHWLTDSLPLTQAMGTVDGVPAVSGNWFLGIEDPHAHNAPDPTAAASGAGCRLRRAAPLSPGQTLTTSFVVGVAPEGQMRRAFLHYLERERAHPYRPFLHYNSWYDIAWSPFHLNETNCLEAIHLFGQQFIQRHGVALDAMVFDDGWDNPQSLWQFHAGFPRGFAPLAQACQTYQTRLGVWLSPFGGYGEPRDQRLRYGSAQGYETNATGFSLAGPRYYAAFKQACLDMIQRYGVNHFKFDGIAAGMYASGGADYVRDTEAMRRLMLELRDADPHLFINLTTGSWPSPFWLRFADSLWRQGGDMGYAGPGPKQEQWLTYRDQETYRNVVRKSPLYPLNALMTQGVAYSREGSAGDPSFNAAGFKNDVRAFFGAGTGLQELYLQPGRLTDLDWRVLAEAAQWSRAHADVLVDTHWISGDPSRAEPYGYASWTPRKGILMIRNPSDRPRDFLLEVGAAFELPPHSATHWILRSPWAEDAPRPTWLAQNGVPLRLALHPFEVLVLEATPAQPNPTHQTAPQLLPLLPYPAQLELKSGHFQLQPDTQISAGPGAEAEASKLTLELRRLTGLPLTRASQTPRRHRIHLELNPSLSPILGPEGYSLSIQTDRILLQATAPAGLFYAGITLAQLADPAAPAPSAHTPPPHPILLPCLEITDQPRFPYRGLLLDVARHFMPLDFLKKFIDLAARHKFNHVQLHLTDDQGWRVEIPKYPRLTEIGARRAESPRPGDRHQGDGQPYGPFFYTQHELRELVAFAQTRHVTLVPEIEMPGHMVAAFAAYPELSCRGQPLAVRTRWGIEPDVLCPGNETAIAFALDVLTEIMDLFPSPFIHIGGDEAPRDRWKECPKCQARLRAEGLDHEAQLQTYLNHRIESHLAARGRRLLGWDEILEGGLTPGATVMSWRGVDGGLQAARQGHDVVMSPTSHCYLDYAQAHGPTEPEAIGGFIPLETVYRFEPVPPELAPSQIHHILGTQGNLWTEFMWSPQDVEYFAYPRAAALAEVAWSPAAARDWISFQHRLASHLPRLDRLGVPYRRQPLTSH